MHVISVEATRDTNECMIAGIHKDEMQVEYEILLDQLDEQIGEINWIPALEKLFGPYCLLAFNKILGSLQPNISILNQFFQNNLSITTSHILFIML